MNSEQSPRVLHLGLGRFHRGHQAWYFDRLNEIEKETWNISSWSMRSPAARDRLKAQGMQYQIFVPAKNELRKIFCITEVGSVRDDFQLLRQRFTSPELQLITLTVTEKGYCLDSKGELNLADEDISYDLGDHTPTMTSIGTLAFGLKERWKAGLAPVTVLSCDNIRGNGHKLQNALLKFAQKDQKFCLWLKTVAFPNSMVDRIVPSLTADQLRNFEKKAGLIDPEMIVTEEFSQWIIEDKFTSKRPPLERVGVRFVEKVEPFEEMKLFLFNAAHSCLAYGGLLDGYKFVHEAVADGVLRDRVIELHEEVKNQFEENMDSYCEAVLHRLSQTDIPHSLVQIAMDGSQKLPHRIFVSLQRAYHQGLPRRALLLTLASWIKYLDTNLPVNDPLNEELIKIREQNPEQFFKNLMKHKLFEGLIRNPSFIQELKAAYESF